MNDLRNLAHLTIKEAEDLFKGAVTDELIAAAENDGRKALLKLAKRFKKERAERERVAALYKFERECAAEGFAVVAGVDEAGRGPLAGPVSVAAVILPPELFLPKINDSKKISAKVRDELFELISAKAVGIGHTFVDAETIDRVNIRRATEIGMAEAIAKLSPQPQKVLIDAMTLKELRLPQKAIIKGDALSASIAAASIIAKVKRDRLMDEYDKKYPGYGFARHKGYGTQEHIAAIKKYGICPIHRRSFARVT